MVELSETSWTPQTLLPALAEKGIGMVPFGATRIRAVLHLEIGDPEVELALGALRAVVHPSE
jgi:hypothetical protein